MTWITMTSNFEGIHNGMEVFHSIFGGALNGKKY
jgi:hypothetical protein